MKYRIVKKTYQDFFGNEVEKFYPQDRVFLIWHNMEECGDAFCDTTFPIIFDTLEEARDYIGKQSEKMLLIKEEIIGQ